jgi:hypothetical protein
MFLSMVRASEKAVRILIDEQQRCEELIWKGRGRPSVFDFRGPQEQDNK